MNLKVIFRVASYAVSVAVLIGMLSGLASAQLPSGSISGTVQDSSQAAIPGATVIATSTETGATRTIQSGPDGHYVLLALPVSVYDLKAEAASFGSVVQRGLTLAVSQEAVINFTLSVGSVSQEVSVTAEAPLVETTSGTLGALVSEQRVAELPLNGRNYSDLTYLQPGISIQRPSSTSSPISQTGILFSSNGAGIRSNFQSLDGANLVTGQGYNGASAVGDQLGVDGIREFIIVTNGLKAEYGMVMGSQTMIATKSGTNQFHGTAFDFFRNSALDARNFFTVAPLSPTFRRNNFGGAFGGPIKKDKTFFFLTYEGLRQLQNVSQPFNVLTADAHLGKLAIGGGATTFATPVSVNRPVIGAYLDQYPNATSCLPTLPLDVFPYCTGGVGRYTQVWPTPTRDDYGQARVDHTFSEKDGLFGRYTTEDSYQLNTVGSFSQWPKVYSSRGTFITLAENHVFSNVLLDTSRLSYSRTIRRYSQTSEPAALGFISGIGEGTVGPGSGVSALGSGTLINDVQGLITFSNDLSWSHGAHTFKFGALINMFNKFNNYSQGNGAFTFSNLTNFLKGIPLQFNGPLPGSNFDRTYRYYTYGFYAQDDWRVTSRLTLNMGLRYEFNTTVNEVNGRGWSMRNIQTDSLATINRGTATYLNPSLHNFGPRVGFAWDIFGNSKTSLRGAYSYLYDIASMGEGLGLVLNGEPPLSGISTVTSTSPDLPGCTGTPCLGGTLTFPIPTIPASALGKVARPVDWFLKQPSMQQFNLTLEQALPGSMSVSLTYAGSLGKHLMTIVEANPTIPTIINGVPSWNGSEKRINPNWNTIEERTANSNSYYNSLQVNFQKKFSHGFQFQTSYTWSHCLDTTQGETSGEAGGSFTTSSNPTQPGSNRANCDYDVRHQFIFNTFYNLPNPIASGWGHTALGGWRLGTILTLKSGDYFTVYDSSQPSRSGVGTYTGLVQDVPNVVPGCNVILGGPDKYFNPACFTPQLFVTSTGALCPAVGSAAPGYTWASGCYGQLGNEGRNTISGPGFKNWDFSLIKDTHLHWLGEAGNLQFRAEFFNILNHPNFNIPAPSSGAGGQVYTVTSTAVTAKALTSAGSLNNIVGSNRQIQIALKLIF